MNQLSTYADRDPRLTNTAPWYVGQCGVAHPWGACSTACRTPSAAAIPLPLYPAGGYRMTDDTRDPTAPPDPAEMDESEAPIEDANDETVEDEDVEP